LLAQASIKGDRSYAALKGVNNNYLLAATQNRGPIQIYKSKLPVKMVVMAPDDVYAILNFEKW